MAAHTGRRSGGVYETVGFGFAASREQAAVAGFIKKMSNVFRIALLTLSFACAATAGSLAWQGPRTISGNSGEQFCAKHHQPLQRVTVFGPAAGVCVLVQPSKGMTRQLARSPNALPFGVHRKPDLLYSRAVQTLCCLRCEEEVQRASGR